MIKIVDIDYHTDFSQRSSLTFTETSVTTRSVSAANFSRADEVYVVVAAIDGKERGNFLECEIQILDTAPTRSGVSIDADADPPAAPTVLTAKTQGWLDDDGDVKQILCQR